MKKALKFLGLLTISMLCMVRATAEEVVNRPVVVELFTSQGCSSCPPADALLARLAQRRDVIALSLPITYWDMLGWKDTLATEANTRRQKSYAKVMGHGGVYTPQMIIDGLDDVVGSREVAVNTAITARRTQSLTTQSRFLVQTLQDRGRLLDIPVWLSATSREVRIVIGHARDRTDHDATIWMFRVLSQATVKVGGGENSGRTLTYRNIVRDVKAVGMWKGDQIVLELPRGDSGVSHDGVAVVVQQGGYGRIFGAAYIGHPNYYAEQ